MLWNDFFCVPLSTAQRLLPLFAQELCKMSKANLLLCLQLLTTEKLTAENLNGNFHTQFTAKPFNPILHTKASTYLMSQLFRLEFGSSDSAVSNFIEALQKRKSFEALGSVDLVDKLRRVFIHNFFPLQNFSLLLK